MSRRLMRAKELERKLLNDLEERLNNAELDLTEARLTSELLSDVTELVVNLQERLTELEERFSFFANTGLQLNTDEENKCKVKEFYS